MPNALLYHVVAMSRNRVIGKDNKLPWHFSADLKHFKELTLGSTIIMGRRTYDSIGKPLPGRKNFILSRASNPRASEPLNFFASIDQALSQVKTPKAFIIGGEQIFKQTLDKIDGIYLTLIDQDYAGDAYYPELPKQFEERTRKKLQDNPKIEVIFYENTSK
jgi:dihydrofolate reductase